MGSDVARVAAANLGPEVRDLFRPVSGIPTIGHNQGRVRAYSGAFLNPLVTGTFCTARPHRQASNPTPYDGIGDGNQWLYRPRRHSGTASPANKAATPTQSNLRTFSPCRHPLKKSAVSTARKAAQPLAVDPPWESLRE